MKIRKALVEEAHGCEDVLRAAFGDYVRRLGRTQGDDAYVWLPDAISQDRVLVAMTGNFIAGVLIHSDSGAVRCIEQVVVRPDRQGSGVGSALIERAEQESRATGIGALELDTAEIMTDLLRLYRRHGFEVVGRGLPKHGRDDHMRVFMHKALVAPES